MHPKISIKLQNHKIQKQIVKYMEDSVEKSIIHYYLELKTLNYIWEIEKQKK